MKLIDTHAHLNFRAFKNDFEKVISKSLKNDIGLINIGTNFFTSKKAVEIAEKYERGVFAAIGLHPINIDTGLVKLKTDPRELDGEILFEKDFDFEKYKKLAQSSSKIVAIGEIGLDYYYRPKTKRKLTLFKEKQKEIFIKQLEMAKELNLPVILHCRMAHSDLFEILKLKIKDQNFKIKGVLHGFVGTLEELNKYLSLGLFIGFNGIIFKKIEGIDFKRIIKETPLDKILVETDCPYLAPPNFPFFKK